MERIKPYSDLANMSVSFSGGYKVFGKSALYSNAFSDTLWLLNQANEAEGAFLFDFEGNQWAYGFDVRKVFEPEIGSVSYLMSSYFLDDKMLFATIKDKKRYRQIMYSRNQQESFNEYSFADGVLFKVLKTPRGKIDETTYFTSITAQFYSGLRSSYPEEWEEFILKYPALTERLEKMLNDEENPALMNFRIEY